jgi:hypothetical protein
MAGDQGAAGNVGDRTEPRNGPQQYLASGNDALCTPEHEARASPASVALTWAHMLLCW